MPDTAELIERLYRLFNARELNALLDLMHPDVVWANGMEGGHVHGRHGVRDYWTRQWAMIDPHVEPIRTFARGNGSVAVEVRQTVRDLAGKLLSDTAVGHVFRIEGGVIIRFDIE